MAEEEPFDAPRRDPEEEAARRQIDEAMNDEAIERSIRSGRRLFAVVVALIFALLFVYHLWDKYSG